MNVEPVSMYSHALFRQSPHISTQVRDLPNFFEQIIFWSAVFCILGAIVIPVVKAVTPRWYSTLPAQKKFELPVYVTCLLHHFVVIPFGIYHIYLDFNRSDASHRQYDYARELYAIVPFTFGYLIGDTVFFTIWEALKGQYEYFFHHVLLFGLVFYLIELPGHFMRSNYTNYSHTFIQYIPYLLILEISQTLLVLAWFGRLLGCGSHWGMRVVEVLFVVTFTVLRMFHLPVVFWALLDKLSGSESAVMLMVGRALIWPLQTLQCYWFVKVLASIHKKLYGVSSREQRAAEDGDNSNNDSSSSKREFRRE